MPRFAAVLLIAASVLATSSSGADAAPHSHKVPADAAGPTAGECDAASGRYVLVDVEPNAPAPRCWQVRPGQRLRVRDDLRRTVRVKWRPFATVTLRPGQTVTFDRPFARYLQPGDHRAWISAYAGGGGFELVLPGHRHEAPPPAAG